MILLTGGAGFIGSVLAFALNLQGRKDLIIVDRFRSAHKWKNLRGVKYLEFIPADDLFSDLYKDLFDKIEVIYHLGASSSTTVTDMDYLYQNNVAYSCQLFKIAVSKNIPFIYASSAATYGAGELGYSDQLQNIARLLPLNPYGYSKQLFDEWVLNENKKPQIWFGLKFFNVYGPHEYHKDDMRSLVCKSYEQIKNVGRVKLFKSYREGFADGKQLRDFIYVFDVVRIILQLTKVKDCQHSGIYNVGTGAARSFLDLVTSTFDALKIKSDIEFIDMPETIKNQYQYFTEADTKKLLNVLGDFRFTSLEKGVLNYVQNYLDNADPYLSFNKDLKTFYPYQGNT